MPRWVCPSCQKSNCVGCEPIQWTQEQIDNEMFRDEECGMCGGTGVYDGECECGEDTCCCLEPTPIVCPQCGGR